MSIEAQPPSRASGPSYGFSIRTHLLRLIAAVILPMLALAGVLAWYYGSAARQTIEAERLDVAKPVISRALDTLGRQELILRKRDPSDRRNVLVQRTVKGALFVENLGDIMITHAKQLIV